MTPIMALYHFLPLNQEDRKIPYEGPCPVDGGGVGHKTFACGNLYVLIISVHVFFQCIWTECILAFWNFALLHS